MSYIPGPNFEPVKAILKGCPTPLKLVSFDLINSFTIGSNVSLGKEEVSKRLTNKKLS